MADPAHKRATYADLEAVPSHLVAELIGGVLHTHPRPSPRHTRAASRLGMRLGRAFDEGADGPGGWWILDEPELHLLEEEVLVPDLAGWRVEHMEALPDTAYFEISPNWICEILSPSTEAEDRAEKMPVYAAAGVGHAWLIDPILETLEVFRLKGDSWLLVRTLKGNAPVRIEPFDAAGFDLGALWREPKRSA